MRASPACQVSLQRVGAWRIGVAVLAASALAAIAAWTASREAPFAWSAWAVLGTAMLLMLGLAISLWRVPAQGLRWDGQGWLLDAVPGDIRVAIDLGPWMLLVFTPTGRAGRARWLPLQRRGLEPQWHALRCAVYSPRPAATEP